MVDQPTDQRLCFVIGPIGDLGTDVRRHADWLLNGIVKPVFAAHFANYKVERADEIVAPGSINSQVITRIMDASLVIADMSMHNANAFYELAIRHMVRLPTIHMIRNDWKIPFDVAPYRAIPFSLVEHAEIEAAKEALKGAVEEAIKPGFAVENPITHARGVAQIREHATGEGRVILDEVQTLKDRINRVEVLTTILASPSESFLSRQQVSTLSAGTLSAGTGSFVVAPPLPLITAAAPPTELGPGALSGLFGTPPAKEEK